MLSSCPRSQVSRAARSWLTVVGLMVASVAPRGDRITRGQNVFVVAVKTAGDSAVFRPCSNNGGVPRTIERRRGRELVREGAELIPGGVGDSRLRQVVEDRLRKVGRFKVAPEVVGADVVLILQAQYGPAFSGSVPAGSFKGSVPIPLGGAGMLDTPASTLLTVMAVAVPASSWRNRDRDAATLLPTALWRGIDRKIGDHTASIERLIDAFSKHPERDYEQKTESPERQDTRPLPPEPGSMLNDQQPPPPPAREIRSTVRPTVTICPSMGSQRAPVALSTSHLASNAETSVDAVRATLVGVPLLASTSDGVSVTGLTIDDFRIYVDGIERPIVRLLKDSDPVSIAVALDSSESMRARFESVRGAAAAFFGMLRPADAVLVASFSGGTYLHTEFTHDLAAARLAVLEIKVGGQGTRLYDTVDVLTVNRLRSQPYRKVLLLLTDGVDVRAFSTSSLGSSMPERSFG